MEHVMQVAGIKIARYQRERGSRARIDPCVRLYCTQAYGDGSWALQIRGAEGVGRLGLDKGERDYIAHAQLGRYDLERLREAITLELGRFAE